MAVWASTTRDDLWRIHAVLPLTALLALHSWVEGGFGYFWPGWALLGLGLTAGVHTLHVLGVTR